MALTAITRGVSPALARCELTHRERVPIDHERAADQHAAYEAVLAGLGCTIRRLPADPDHPDCVFVEDLAVVFDELAVVTRPGAPSRRGEAPPVADALREFRPLVRLRPPAVLDGGDVLVTGRRVFVGLSSRTDEAGAAQLAAAVGPHGYEVTTIAVPRALHLKTAATEAAPGLLLIDPERIDPGVFAGLEHVAVAPGEGAAANALRIGTTLLVAAGFEGTRRRLEALGLAVVEVANDELAKAEGGLTCCSLLVATVDAGETAASGVG